MSSTLLLLIHAAATWFMVGLIWFVQIVHYPLFSAVGPPRVSEAITAQHLTLSPPPQAACWEMPLGL
ncbi:hypothetical protein L6R49_27300, partial [Myxococcota bacterium]|nr:hypothetical protein [Myxococcota bacterium]